MNDELEAVRGFRSEVGGRDAARRDVYAHLQAEIIASGDRTRTGETRAPTRRRSVSIAAVAAIAVALLSIPILFPRGATLDPAAASLLHGFSSRALETPTEPAPRPGQYVYERTVSRGLYLFTSTSADASFRYFVDDDAERWLGVDGSGRSISTMGEPVFLTPTDREAYEAYVASGAMQAEWGDFDWGESHTDTYRAGELSFFDFSTLPTDVDELRGMIERREIIGGPDGDWETFNLSGDILTWSYAPPPLRAALFEVMANLPGVELIGPTEDAFGRRGVAIGYTHDDQRQEIVLRPSTGEVLERRWISVAGVTDAPDPSELCSGPCGASEMAIAGPPGTTSYVTTYEIYGDVVDDIGDVA